MIGNKSPATPSANRVLVAEDNPVVRKGLINFLKKWGYTPIETDNGDDAIQILEEDHSVRLAILDWNLPGLTGMQICQRLRTRSESPYVYTIIFSARKSKEEQVLALDGGADDYLVKPCKPSELRARLGVGRRIIEVAIGTPSSLYNEQEKEKNQEMASNETSKPTASENQASVESKA